jgi:hypothetical protein
VASFLQGERRTSHRFRLYSGQPEQRRYADSEGSSKPDEVDSQNGGIALHSIPCRDTGASGGQSIDSRAEVGLTEVVR